MTKILNAAAAAALFVPALAFAEVIVVDGEAGMIFKDEPSHITRAQVIAEMKSGKDVGDVHFRYVGGEAGWIHETPSHRMEAQGSSLVHASDCPVMASLTAPKTRPVGSDDLVYHGA
jgi:hypothetical protein